jgi:arylsulfatase A-like enzyme
MNNRLLVKTCGVFVPLIFISGCGGGSGSEPVNNQVMPIANQSPQISTSIPDHLIPINRSFSFDVTQDGRSFTDPDNDVLSYNVSLSPPDAGFNVSGSHVVGNSASAVDIDVTVTATDGNGGSVSDSFVISVHDGPKLLKPIENFNLSVGEAFSIDTSQQGETFSDPTGQGLTYQVMTTPNQPHWQVDQEIVGGTHNIAETVKVEVTAVDSDNLSTTIEFSIVFESSQQREKNILLIIADDLGQDSSAQYSLSTDLPNTPTLNQLASEGIIFDNLWVNPVCSPTRATLITGKYGTKTNVLSPGDSIDLEEFILQEALKNDDLSQAYKTAIVGKWHLGGSATMPNDAGVDHFAGVLGGGVGDYFNWTININGQEQPRDVYTTTEFTNQAISWISEQQQPWFMWLAYNAPHTPFHLPPADLHNRKLSGDEEDISRNPRAYYLAAVEALDSELGRLLSSMSAEARENTTILFIGDNGTPGRAKHDSALINGSKGSVFEGGIRVPMIVSGAGVARVGARESALVNGTDFYSTILSLSGKPSGNVHDSKSFYSLLANEGSEAPREFIFSQSENAYTIRNEKYKLIRNSDLSHLLYDLISDPTEQNSLYGQPSVIEQQQLLESQLDLIIAGEDTNIE